MSNVVVRRFYTKLCEGCPRNFLRSVNDYDTRFCRFCRPKIRITFATRRDNKTVAWAAMFELMPRLNDLDDKPDDVVVHKVKHYDERKQDREIVCTRKDAFVSKRIAEQVARSMRRRNHNPVQTYRCPFKIEGDGGSPHWHVGQDPRKP
jgi:hypothetical protein